MLKQFTATVYVAALVDNQVKVLLHRHKKLAIWCGLGGHVEGDENPVEAAMREAKEEADIKVTIIPFKKRYLRTPYVSEIAVPFIILEEMIPKYEQMAQHIHVDSIFFGIIHDVERVKMVEPFAWFSLEELKRAKIEQKEILFIAKQTIKMGEKYLK